MSVAKVIEITASSPTSFAEAAKAGIAKAAETVHGIKGASVSEESLVVENDQVTEFRVTSARQLRARLSLFARRDPQEADSGRSDPRLRRGRIL